MGATWRRQRGPYFEDLEIGRVESHPLGRTITEADNTWFTLLTMNTNEMHFNASYADDSEFQRILVNSTLTLAVVVGLSVVDTSQCAVANLGWDAIRLSHPVFVGDTLRAESMVTHKRASASRPHAGIVTFHTRGRNQEGTIVISFDRTVLVHRAGHGPGAATLPASTEPWPPISTPPHEV